MTDNDDLPSWSADQQPRAAQQPEPPRRSRGRGLLFGLLGLLALIGMGALGYFIAQSQADDETAATDPGAPTATEDESDESDESSLDSEVTDDDVTAGEDDGAEGGEALDVDTNGDAMADGDGDGDDSDGADDDADADDTAQSDDTAGPAGDDSGRTAVFRGGKLYLGGKVPSQEIADVIVGKAQSVVGPDNVIAEYEIDPTVEIDPGESTPLYVEDVVLFRFNSVEIDPPFVPLLDLGTLLLSQNPQATLTVVTRTDAVGSEEVNLDVARKRANAVIEYWVDKGISPDQLKADPRGEELASDNDDEEAAALQRRAEFIITGLLD